MSPEPKQYFIACAVIFNKDRKVLLTKRHNPKNTEVHNKWQIPGGGIEHAEHPRDTALREVTEETGIAISLQAQHPHVYSHTFNNGAHIVMLIYIADYMSGEVDISADSEETSDFDWFSLDEVLELDSLPETTHIIQDAFNLKFHN